MARLFHRNLRRTALASASRNGSSPMDWADSPPEPSSDAIPDAITGCCAPRLLPPVGRILMLNRLGEILRIADKINRRWNFPSINSATRFIRAATNIFAGSIWKSPWHDGNTKSRAFASSRKSRCPGETTSSASATRVDPGERQMELSLLPFVRMMDFHALRHEKATFEESHGPSGLLAQAGIEQADHHCRRRLFSAAAGLVVRTDLCH